MIKKSLDKKVEEILTMVPSEQFIDIADELNIVADAIAVLQLPLCKTKECANEVVFHLSSFAEKYGKVLHEISKKYPLLYLEIDQTRDDSCSIRDWDTEKDEFDDDLT